MLAEQIKRRPDAQQHGGDDAHLRATVPTTCARCEQLGIAAYLLKPVKQSELLEAIELALGIASARQEAAGAARRSGRGTSARCGSCWPRTVRSTRSWPWPCWRRRATGHRGRQRPGGARGLRIASVRPGADGRADAGDGRPGGHRGDPRPGTADRRPHSHHRHDRPRAQRRPPRCLEAGMDGYIAKPIRPHELMAAIQATLGGAAARERSCVAAAVPAAGSFRPSVAAEAVDWSEAARAVGHDPALLSNVVQTALAEIPRLMAELRGRRGGRRRAAGPAGPHTGRHGPLFRRRPGRAMRGRAGARQPGRANWTAWPPCWSRWKPRFPASPAICTISSGRRQPPAALQG